MQREIKFRCKIKGDAGVYEVQSICWIYLKMRVSRACGDEWLDFDKIQDLMMYTGLRAKNGEIYEGDIVAIWGGGKKPLTGVVNFKDGCFCLRWDQDDENKNPELKYYIDMDFCVPEIIGNIYENKRINQCKEK